MTTTLRSIIAILLCNLLVLAGGAVLGQVPLPLMVLGEIGISVSAGVLGWVIGRNTQAEHEKGKA